MSFWIMQGDARKIPLVDDSVDCVVTSPPYWSLRNYGVEGQIGLELTITQYVAQLVRVFNEVKRVLKPEGTCWIVLGDTYAANRDSQVQGSKHKDVGNGKGSRLTDGLKAKDLCGIPWKVAFALQEAGWYLRADIIWAKPNPMPESVRDRPTKAHEYIFLLTKSERYYWDQEAAKEPPALTTHGNRKAFRGAGAYTQGNSFDNSRVKANAVPGMNNEAVVSRNVRSVWTVATQGFAQAHFATMPTEIVKRCVLMGCPVGGIVFDPFCGAATTGVAANRLGRFFIGLELNPAYVTMGEKRMESKAQIFGADVPGGLSL